MKAHPESTYFSSANHHFNTSIWIPCLTRGPPESICQYLQQTFPGADSEFTEQGLKSDIQWKSSI